MADQVQASLENLEAAVENVLNRASAFESDADSTTALVNALQTARATGVQTSGLRGQMMDAIDEALPGDLVDLVIYDTTQDPGSHDWRFDTSKSWYNEQLGTATRGLRREFPALAVIAVGTGTVTIYDADDPSLPMWMVCDGSTPTVVNGPYIYANGGNRQLSSGAMKCGFLVVGTNQQEGVGVIGIDFVRDVATKWNESGCTQHAHNIAGRNISADNEGYVLGLSGGGIFGGQCQDVDLEVLPGAPTVNGVPVPTIAAAMEQGLSVIHPDGSTNGFRPDGRDAGVMCQFGQGHLHFAGNVSGNGPSSSGVNVAYPYEDLYEDRDHSRGEYALGEREGHGGLHHPQLGSNTGAARYSVGQNLIASHFGAGGSSAYHSLGLYQPQYADFSTSMVHRATTWFVTGWMPGNIKGAWCCSTEPQTISGGNALSNGSFDADLSGWEADDTVAWENGTARITNGTSIGSQLRQSVSADPQLAYELVFNVVAKSEGQFAVFASGAGQVATSVGVRRLFLGSGQNTILVDFKTQDENMDVVVDDVSIRPVIFDRSPYQQNVSVLSGDVTVAPVADGAELCSFHGGIKEQPYNPELDFGTGDFCYMGWIVNEGSYQGLFHRSSVKSNDVGFRVSLHAENLLVAKQDGTTVIAFPNIPEGWRHVAYVRRSGQGYLYVDGVEVGSAPHTTDVTDTGATLLLGQYYQAGGVVASAEIALVRATATPPTPEQIRFIYETERRLFEPGAQCTTTNGGFVRDLSFDPVTDLLHVVSNNGREVFDGLRRIERHPGDYDFIRAHGGMIACK